jgi:glycerophosphoryl diester phosphodiesterase
MNRRLAALAAVLLVLAAIGALAPVAMAVAPVGLGRAAAGRPHFAVMVVGHRGAPAYRPEHTIESYQLAIDQGADYIEPDLVSTRDGHLIARHESDLTLTTDVAAHPELGGRTRSEELTLAEVKTLRAGGYAIPTLEEIVELLHRQTRHVGLYVELKAPAYFRAIGLPMEERLAAVLDAQGWTDADAPAFVSSFEADSLRRMRQLTGVPLVQIIAGFGPRMSPEQLSGIAEYAVAISVHRDRLGRPLPARERPALLYEAREWGLAVHLYTLGADCPYGRLPASLGNPADPADWSDAVRMYRAFYALGIAAVFSDAPDIAVYARG